MNDAGYTIREASFKEIEHLRSEFRKSVDCQIVRDSILSRGLATPYLICEGSSDVGYGGVWSKHFPGRVMEFHVRSNWVASASSMFQELLRVSGANAVEAQTNIPLIHGLATEFGSNLVAENLLFDEGASSDLSLSQAEFRRRTNDDDGPEGDWVVTRGGRVIGGGGFLHHYNPPYSDLYMAVSENDRRKGVGSYLVQELRRVCGEEGRKPSARCDVDNVASRRTLLRGGMQICGRLVAGPIK